MKNKNEHKWLRLIAIILFIINIIAIIGMLLGKVCNDDDFDALDEWLENSQIEGGIYTYPVTFFLLDMRYVRFENGEVVKLVFKKDWWSDWDVTGVEEVDPEEVTDSIYRLYEDKKISLQQIESFLGFLAEGRVDTTTIRTILRSHGIPVSEESG